VNQKHRDLANLDRYDEALYRRAPCRARPLVIPYSRPGSAIHYEIRQRRRRRGDKQRETVKRIRGLSTRSESLHSGCSGAEK